MVKTLKIKVYVKEVNHNGKKFLTYKAITKDDKFIDLRFTRECDSKRPQMGCYIVVPADKINLAKDYIKTDKGQTYDCFWVSEIIDTIPFKSNDEHLSDFFEVID